MWRSSAADPGDTRRPSWPLGWVPTSPSSSATASGGSTVLTDCVPSKTLIATSDLLTEVESSAELGVRCARAMPVRTSRSANDRVTGARAGAVRRHRRSGSRPAGWTVLDGTATLEPAGGVVATTSDGETRASRPHAVLRGHRRPPADRPTAQPDGERILTWEQVYGLRELPEHMIVVGSGVTGAEFASAYNGLGVAGHPRVEPRPGAARRGRATPRPSSRTSSPAAA